MSSLAAKVKSKESWKKIKDINLDLSYCDHFLPKKIADKLFKGFEEEFEYFSGDLTKVKVFGKWHNIPRQQVAYGDDGLTYKFSGNEIPALPWPESLKALKTAITDITGHSFNFVLVNRYRNGDDCIGEHKDDESELDSSVPIISVSFGQTRDIIFKYRMSKKELSKKAVTPPVKKIPLSHGDLLCMNDPTNKFWVHAVPRRKNAPGVRISLTFRQIVSSERNEPSVTKGQKRKLGSSDNISPYFA